MKLRTLQLSLILSSLLLLFACATKPFNLEGRWHISAPSGEVYELQIQEFENGSFYLYQEGLVLSGIYHLEGKHLIMKKPNDPRLKNYKWLRKNNQFILIDEPPVSLTGKRYLGSSLIKAQ